MRLLAMSLVALALPGCGRGPSEALPVLSLTPQELAAFSAGNNTLAAALYPAIKETSPGNIFYSPTGVAAALALVYPGARGQTAEEIGKVLAVNLPRDRFIECGSWFHGELTNRQRDGVEVKLANAVWGQQDTPWRPQYLDILKRKHGAELRKADFSNQPEQARQLINQWAAEQTGK
jgi:serpin B